MKEIFERRSIRKYTEQEVPEKIVNELLKAAMAAPSARNEQPWEFIVIRDKECMKRIMEVHPYAQMLKEAPVAIAVCADSTKETAPGYWAQDCAAATQNLLLAAQHLGLGTVWLGIYPRDERVAGLKKILGIPEDIIPVSLVAVGYPAEKKDPTDRFDSSRVHFDKW